MPASTTARLPIRPAERVYKGYSSFLLSGITCGASTLLYAIGGVLPYVGNTLISIVGYLCGIIVCMGPAILAALPSYRYGLDTTDAMKPALGVRGAALVLVGVLASGLGWTFILLALSARSFGNLVKTASGAGGSVNEMYVVCFGILLLGLLWLLSRRGAAGLERVTAIIAPVQLLFAVILLGLVINRFGVDALLHANVPADKAFSRDPAQQLALAFEFGFAGVLGFFPFLGGLVRLVSNRRHLVGPMVIGCGAIGCWFVAAVSSYAAVLSGTADPTIWVVTIGGKWFGSTLLLFMLLANVGTMVLYLYVGAAASQQLKVLTNMPWPWLTAILLSPGIYFAFYSQWLLEKVVTFMTYSGLLFVGVLGVSLVDYFLLRRQQIDPAHVFSRSKHGKYWFWGGVNWVGLGVSLLGCAVYLWIYDPVTLKSVGAFRYMGAGLPVCAACALVYFVIMKLFVVRGCKGGYATEDQSRPASVEIAL